MKAAVIFSFLFLYAISLSAQASEKFFVGLEPAFLIAKSRDDVPGFPNFSVYRPSLLAGGKVTDYLEVAGRLQFLFGKGKGFEIENGWGYGLDSRLLVNELLPLKDEWALRNLEYFVTAKFLAQDFELLRHGIPRKLTSGMNPEYRVGGGMGLRIFSSLWVRADLQYGKARYGYRTGGMVYTASIIFKL